jgi:ParB-like chromosome segregation protein Spo0J
VDVTHVRLESLRRGFSARSGPEDVKHAQVLVEAFEKLPPIIVHRPTMAVIDEHHRVLAARMLQRPTMPAVFFDGDEDEAYVEAVRHNVAHGRPLNIQEREHAASRLIASHPN